MQSDRDLPREKARYQPPIIQVVKLLTKETVLGVCKTFSGAGGTNGQCNVANVCYESSGLT